MKISATSVPRVSPATAFRVLRLATFSLFGAMFSPRAAREDRAHGVPSVPGPATRQRGVELPRAPRRARRGRADLRPRLGRGRARARDAFARARRRRRRLGASSSAVTDVALERVPASPSRRGGGGSRVPPRALRGFQLGQLGRAQLSAPLALAPRLARRQRAARLLGVDEDAEPPGASSATVGNDRMRPSTHFDRGERARARGRDSSGTSHDAPSRGVPSRGRRRRPRRWPWRASIGVTRARRAKKKLPPGTSIFVARA